MTENYKNLRDALAAAPTDDNWICVPYSKKTLGVGVAGGPALFMAREGSYTGIDDALEIVRNLLSVRREARALLAERDALRAAVLAIDSLRGPFMSDDDIASVWKLVDSALAQHQGEKHDANTGL